MTAHAEGIGEQGASHTYDNVTCPFCGLLCDDLQVTRTGSTLKVNNGCPRAIAGFQRPLPPAKPLMRDREVSFEEAVRPPPASSARPSCRSTAAWPATSPAPAPCCRSPTAPAASSIMR